MTKVCCVFNIAAHYRESIYVLMDKELHCDFYIGYEKKHTIKLMDYELLHGFKSKLSNVNIPFGLHWQKGIYKPISGNYDTYIITGDFKCLSNWLLLIICKIRRKNVIAWTHGWYGREGLLKKYIKKIFFSFCSHIILYGDYARNLMIKEGFNPNKLSCIYNSLNYERDLEIRATVHSTNIYSSHFNNDWPTMIFVGRIQKIKRIDMLIKAYSEILKNGEHCNLVLVGDIIDDPEIITMMMQLNVKDKIWLYGPCHDEKVLGELFYNAAVCVSPGNVGLTAIHSLSFGCPVITHNNFKNQMPEFECIEDGNTGSFFEENNLSSLINKIDYWSSPKIISRRDIIRENAYKIIDDRYNPFFQMKTLKNILYQR
jgi:glycosyltransferase involved in cell wall biosynthesis